MDGSTIIKLRSKIGLGRRWKKKIELESAVCGSSSLIIISKDYLHNYLLHFEETTNFNLFFRKCTA